MKKVIIVICFAIMVLSSSCSKVQDINVEQIKSICELATMECYIHNIAQIEKDAENWFAKDKKIWIEYTGIVKVGIDLMSVERKGNVIEVAVSKAKILGFNLDNEQFKTAPLYESKDGLFKTKISLEEQQAMFVDNSNKAMKECVESNEWVMTNAQNRAKELIENYINQLGELSGKKYTVKWIEVEDDSESVIE